MEETLLLIKPDALQRRLMGEIIGRLERKGLHIIGMKMMQLEDVTIDDHYKHLKGKPFFASLKNFMKSSPIVAIALRGYSAVGALRLIVGATKGYEADAGTIRGDMSLSTQTNIVHASETKEDAIEELKRFFEDGELFEYSHVDMKYVNAEDER